MRCVRFGVNPNHISDIWAFNEDPVEHVLSQVVKLVRKNSSSKPKRIIVLLT